VVGIDAPAQIIAHRGASAYALEHSFAAYDLALIQGADALELDVRPTSDGQLVVLHDSGLLRTAGVPRAIAALCAAELASLDAALRPPTLDAVLDRYGTTTRWLIELKDPTRASERGVAAALTARGLENLAIVQSFDAAALRRLRTSTPSLVVAPLYGRAPGARQLRVVARYAAAVGIRHVAVDLTLLLRARSCGLAVRAWTANAPADIGRLVALGVEGIITDVPDVARAIVDGHAGAVSAA
jgi:glycerophosphoryl diester phosphodiesterase